MKKQITILAVAIVVTALVTIALGAIPSGAVNTDSAGGGHAGGRAQAIVPEKLVAGKGAGAYYLDYGEQLP